ncbi:hypothetical protein M8818_005400 [Zalaria obscura]|uniref:Uncharacterized protein n=1 Tax=Zalaria obscura TaxID=2024903 RepID=A0ACC3S7U9_9PEZI
MLLRRPPNARIPALFRPIRPADVTTTVPRPRPFTQNHPLLLLTRTQTPRPQLPYLSQPSRFKTQGPYRRELARFLTTETRTYVREQVWLATKWTAIGWTLLGLLGISWYGWQSELVERQHPSPTEWRFMSRDGWRMGWLAMDAEKTESGVINWPIVGAEFHTLLSRLEDPNGDGAGLMKSEEGGILIPDVGKAGYDATAKSLEWRDAYFQVVMNCAKAAENMDHYVTDMTRRTLFPKDVVVGPSNPNPRPLPAGKEYAPLEENCVRSFEPPETFYMRILTGKGFDTRQRLEAALGYANWLEFEGLQDSAEQVYKWGLDIASEPLPNAADIIDSQTGVLKEQATGSVTENILRAATALATHQARTGNVSSALPVLLSVLRARGSAPISSYASPEAPSPHFEERQKAKTDIGAAVNFVRGFIRDTSYPLPATTGDEPFQRASASQPDCQDAELMLYIGEILFATSQSKSDDGLGWTKQGVEIAERGISDPRLKKSQRDQCKACMETGINNWSFMVNKLLKQERERETLPAASPGGWKSWFGGAQEVDRTRSRWEEEAKAVEEKRMKIIHEGISQQMIRHQGVPGDGGIQRFVRG